MAKKNRAMLIGSVGAGKSTLTNALLGREVPAVKTQSLIYYDWIVDTPGEYSENPSRIVAMSFCEPRSCRLQLSS